MVYQLSNAGSNNIWEFGLRASAASSKPAFRKPTPTDSLQYIFYILIIHFNTITFTINILY